MEKLKALEKESISAAVRFAIAIALAVILPFFHNQLITGPFINALFYIAVITLGINRAVVIALIPSVVALSVGLLPALIFPIAPFIIMGNLLQIFCFNYLKKNYWLGLAVSSLAKFSFIFLSGQIIFNFLLHKNIGAASMIFSWPQLMTALIGGVIAFAFIRFFKFDFGK